jgi:hypothetical protein
LTHSLELIGTQQRYNLSDEVFDANAFSGWIPSGYGFVAADDSRPQAFAPENIIIVS